MGGAEVCRTGFTTEAPHAGLGYAFGHLSSKATSIGYFDGNDASRRIVEKLGFQKISVTIKRRHDASMARSSTVMNTSLEKPKCTSKTRRFLGLKLQGR
jgi:RimJ/RimL family protein N-acetyltransferase